MPGHWVRRLASYITRYEPQTFTGKQRQARVAGMRGGDTLRVVARKGTWGMPCEYSVRISGIEAPEMDPPAAWPHRRLHKQAAQGAQARLAEILPVGSAVQIRVKSEKNDGELVGAVWTMVPCCTEGCRLGHVGTGFGVGGGLGFGVGCGLQCSEVPGVDVGKTLLYEGTVREFRRGPTQMFTEQQLKDIISKTESLWST